MLRQAKMALSPPEPEVTSLLEAASTFGILRKYHWCPSQNGCYGVVQKRMNKCKEVLSRKIKQSHTLDFEGIFTETFCGRHRRYCGYTGSCCSGDPCTKPSTSHQPYSVTYMFLDSPTVFYCPRRSPRVITDG